MKKFFVLLLAMLFLAACSGGKEGSGETAKNGDEAQETASADNRYPPEEVQEGIDRCDICNMLVPNDYNATQIVLNDGRSLMFDDIGCMVKWIDENGLDEVNAAYVRDYYTQDWIIYEEATFAYDYHFRTPMAYGVLSFASREDAEKFVKEEGKGVVLTYEQLQNHTWERNMEMMEKMKEEMGHHHNHNEGDHSDMDTNDGNHDMMEGHNE